MDRAFMYPDEVMTHIDGVLRMNDLDTAKDYIRLRQVELAVQKLSDRLPQKDEDFSKKLKI
jgi:hypothetical protein